MRPLICIDFDGTISDYSHGWIAADKIPDPPVPGAMAFLVEADRHFEIAIFSSRSHQGGVAAMTKWLVKHLTPVLGSPYAAHKFVTERLSFPTQKPPAFLTIDDRAMCFAGKFPSMHEIGSFKPWHKRNT